MTQCMANLNLFWIICVGIYKWNFKQRKTKISILMGLTKTLLPTFIPLQTNADDCGVYTCLFSEWCGKDGNHNLLVWTEIELNMPRYIKKILYSIIKQKNYLKIKK